MSRLKQAFEAFDSLNPRVWELFKQFSQQAITSGYRVLSASMITERIRWETTVVTVGDDYKLNNNHRAYYARKFEAAFPQYNGYFRKRRVRGE